jgi:hypothetical protein
MGQDKEKGDGQFPQKVLQLYEQWRAIEPDLKLKNKVDSKTVALLQQPYLNDPELSQWALLKASTTFKLYYAKSNKFVWQMAGRQLQFMKALMCSGGNGVPVLAVPSMYAALKPDGRFIKQVVAMMDGEGSQYTGDEEVDFGENEEGLDDVLGTDGLG